MLTDVQGVKAIMDLQKIGGVELYESEEEAIKNWAIMPEEHKKQTEHIHKLVCGGFKENG